MPPAKLSWPVNSNFGIALSMVFVVIVGCGAPGEPTPRSPLVATAISDLAAHQAGDGVELTFSMPARSSGGDRLVSTPAVEILRGAVKSGGAPDLKLLRVVDSIPGSLAGKYLAGDKFQFTDPLSPDETKAHPVFAYAVRTRVSQKRASANSNVVTVPVFSVPERVAAIETHVSETAINLSWAAIERTSAGEPLATAPRYNIYRAELDDAAREAAKRDVLQLSLTGKLQLLASQAENSYSDKAFDFGKTYAYFVRSVMTIDGTPPESSDSSPAIVKPGDEFPPAVPQALAAAVLPGETAGALLVDLSWSINVEPDFAGYRVYRSEQQDTKGQLLTPDLLPTPAYRDTSVQPAHSYWYAVTAVDRAGNESAPSPPVSVEIVQPSP